LTDTGHDAHVLATATGPYLFWIASRAAGTAALLLSSMTVCAGLLNGARLVKGYRVELRVAHEALSLAALAALLVHGLSLLGDRYLHPSVAEVALPFLMGYRTLWTSVGIVAFWMLLVLGLSYYARARIGVQRWRALHRFAALAWLLGLVHALGDGTDAGQTWFLAMIAVAVVPALLLLLARTFGSPTSRAGAQEPPVRPATARPTARVARSVVR
jgi:methionine sulfoxide reductase heme-binding subunit